MVGTRARPQPAEARKENHPVQGGPPKKRLRARGGATVPEPEHAELQFAIADLCALAGVECDGTGDHRPGEDADVEQAANGEQGPAGAVEEARADEHVVEDPARADEEARADEVVEDTNEEEEDTTVVEEPVRAREVLFNKANNLFKFKSESSPEGEVITRGELLRPPHRLYSWFLTACIRNPDIWNTVDDIIDPDGKLTDPLLG